MRFFKYYLVIGFLLLFCDPIISQNSWTEKSITALSKLNEDFSNNIISEEEAISQKFYYLFDRAKLNQKYVSENQPMLECATSVILEYKRNHRDYSLSKRNELTSYIELNLTNSTSSQNYISPSGNFEMIFETTGANAVPLFDNDSNGLPDYIEMIARYCDYSWHLFIDSLGYIPPLIEKRKYRIEFRKMFASGYTIEDPDEKGYTKIILNNNFIEFAKKYGNPIDTMGVAKVTVAHEFKHAVQYMYTQWRDKSWFLELDATWIEDIAYDDVNSYIDFLSTSQITNPGSSFACGMGYGNCIWMHFLTQNFGLQINRDIWETAFKRNITSFSDTTHYNIFNEVLEKYGSTLESSITKYFVWNYFTGANSNSQIQSYKDAKFYPTPKLYTAVNEIPSSGLLYDRQVLSADFIKISGNSIKNRIGINLKFDNSINTAALIVKYKSGYNEIEYLVQLGNSVDYLSNPELKNVAEIVLIPVGISSSTGNFNYTFQVNNIDTNIDLTKPVITVAGNEVQLSIDNFPYMVIAEIKDESGVDSAFIEYKFDDGSIKKSGLERTANNTFNGCICLDTIEPNSLKELQYRIVAIDSSAAGNVGVFPEEGYYNIKIDNPLNITSIGQNEDLTSGFKLYQNYPNPFNPVTTISYTIPFVETTRRVVSTTLMVYDLLGREITTLVNEEKYPGDYTVRFNGGNLPSGIYIYRLKAGNFVQSKNMILLK